MRREPTSDGRRRRGHPPPLSALPLRPLLLLRHPPPLPPHVSSPCILILPIIPTSSLGNPSALLPLPPLPPPRRPPPRERKGIGISKGKRSWKAREGRRRDDDSRLLSIGLSFQPPAFNWHSLPWREKETASPLCVYTYIRACVYFFRSLLAGCHLEKPCLGGGKGGIRTERRINNTRGHVRVKIDYSAGENVINSWTNKEGTCVRAK